MKITTHTIVKNEENWIWYALNAWKPFAAAMLVYDDNSTDKTGKIINSLEDPKIKISKVKLITPADHTELRNRMIAETTTEWFLILDGDEVWNSSTIEKFLTFLNNQPKNIFGVVMRTRNWVGDIYHYQPEEAGKYHLLGKTGHLTIRAYRKLKNFRWVGDYPLEGYTNEAGTALNDLPEHLAFFDNYYWHATHLRRSSSVDKVKGWRKTKLEIGLVAKIANLPDVFSLNRPEIVPSPWKKMTIPQTIISRLVSPLRKIKRHVH